MGRVFKPWYSKKNKNGKTIMEPDGHGILKPKRFEASDYYIEFTGILGRTIRRKGGATKEAAKNALTQAEAELLAVKNGLPAQNVSKIKVAEIKDRFLESLRTRATNGHCKQVDAYLKEVLKECRIVLMKDLLPEKIEAYLSLLAENQNIGSRALNSRIESLKAMLAWAVRTRTIPYNPIDCIQKREKLDSRHERRALTEVEISELLAAALEGPHRRAVRAYQNRPKKDGTYKPADIPLGRQAELAEDGRRIALTYRIMIEAGLRKSETRQVTWNDVDLDQGVLTTRPYWMGNKNGKTEELPLTPGLHQALVVWREVHPGEPTSPIVKVTDRLLECLDDDLVAIGLARRVKVNNKARIEKVDSAGRTIDLHALRHTFGTRLGNTPGIDPKTVQTLMRHSDSRLTFGIYVHTDKSRMREAVQNLPEIVPAKKVVEQVAELKTGTLDCNELQSVSPSIRQASSKTPERREPNIDAKECPEKTSKNGRYRNRTCDLMGVIHAL